MTKAYKYLLLNGIKSYLRGEIVAKYKCGKCGYVFDPEEASRIYGRRIRCPKCTYEIVYKVARPYRVVRAI
jgi:DNA-directed RNA polymerase subunit P